MLILDALVSLLARRVAGRLGFFVLSHVAMVGGGFLIRHFLCGH